MTNPFEICDRMNPDLRELLENYLKATEELHKYCADNNTYQNEHSDTDNYVAMMSVTIYANNKGNYSMSHIAHAAAADRIAASRELLENAFSMASFLENRMHQFTQAERKKPNT